MSSSSARCGHACGSTTRYCPTASASPAHRTLRLAGFAVGAIVLLFVAVAEVTFWIEFATRFNFIAVDYLIYTQEVVGNIRESYPVGWIAAGIAVLGPAIAIASRPAIERADRRPTTRTRRLGWVAAALLLPAPALAVSRIEQMGGSGNAYADELSGNGRRARSRGSPRRPLPTTRRRRAPSSRVRSGRRAAGLADPGPPPSL